MTNQVIPTEAVDAAVEALRTPTPPYQAEGVLTWEQTARIVLEAAAPYMRAAAWEEGMQAMYDTTSSEWPPIPERNPYRPTA